MCVMCWLVWFWVWFGNFLCLLDCCWWLGWFGNSWVLWLLCDSGIVCDRYLVIFVGFCGWGLCWVLGCWCCLMCDSIWCLGVGLVLCISLWGFVWDCWVGCLWLWMDNWWLCRCCFLVMMMFLMIWGLWVGEMCCFLVVCWGCGSGWVVWLCCLCFLCWMIVCFSLYIGLWWVCVRYGVCCVKLWMFLCWYFWVYGGCVYVL